MGSESGEVEGVGLGEGTGGGNILDVSEDGIEKRSGVAELGKLENEADNSDITSWYLLE